MRARNRRLLLIYLIVGSTFWYEIVNPELSKHVLYLISYTYLAVNLSRVSEPFTNTYPILLTCNILLLKC